MCFDGGALARTQYARANFRISPELFIFFGARSFIADKGVLLVYTFLYKLSEAFRTNFVQTHNIMNSSNSRHGMVGVELILPIPKSPSASPRLRPAPSPCFSACPLPLLTPPSPAPAESRQRARAGRAGSFVPALKWLV